MCGGPYVGRNVGRTLSGPPEAVQKVGRTLSGPPERRVQKDPPCHGPAKAGGQVSEPPGQFADAKCRALHP